MGIDARRRGTLVGLAAIVSALAVALVAGMPSDAEEKPWRIRFEPIFMQAKGNDRHVLTVHETPTAMPQATGGTGVSLDTESAVAPRFAFQYSRGSWTYGLDWTTFLTSQDVGPLGGAADGAVSSLEYEVSDMSYSSGGPTEILYYDTLSDTDLETWSLDLYAIRSLNGTDRGGLRMQFGLKFADFDNDYHGVVGIEGVEGSFVDASSNYPRMAGPLFGVVGEYRCGKHEFHGYLGQSVVFGTAELSSSREDFTGPVSSPTVIESETFRLSVEESIPITDLRLGWSYRFNDLVAAGVGIHSAVWWDVSVPPGVTPGPNGNTVLYENTIVLYGLSGAVEFAF